MGRITVRSRLISVIDENVDVSGLDYDCVKCSDFLEFSRKILI
jgi:hypothetical protein